MQCVKRFCVVRSHVLDRRNAAGLLERDAQPSSTPQQLRLQHHAEMRRWWNGSSVSGHSDWTLRACLSGWGLCFLPYPDASSTTARAFETCR